MRNQEIIQDLVNQISNNKYISVMADREIISEIILGLDIEENLFSISNCKPEDDVLLISKIDNLFVVECPFDRETGKLLNINNNIIYIQSDTYRLIDKEQDLEMLECENIVSFEIE